MKRIAALLGTVAALSVGWSAPALAQTTTAVVVAACGTPPGSYTAGQSKQMTQTTGGLLCGSDSATSNPTGITPTDRTITSATGASQTVMSALATRKALTIQNTGSANCGVNPTGGTAAIGGAGTITLAPLGSYTPRVPTLSAVTAICTAGQPLYASEQ